MDDTGVHTRVCCCHAPSAILHIGEVCKHESLDERQRLCIARARMYGMRLGGDSIVALMSAGAVKG